MGQLFYTEDIADRMNHTRLSCLLIPLLYVGLLADPAAGEVAFQKEDGRLRITVDGQPFAVYVWNDATTTRPYFKQIRAAGGKVQITRNHPPAPGDIDDHATFHPGLWWGFGDVGGNDYWRLKARVVGGEFVDEPEGGQERGHFAVRNRLLVNDGDSTFCEQICRYTILQRTRGILMVCESTLRRDAGDFWLGDQEEMGLAVRVAAPIAMASNQGGRIQNSHGSTDLTQIRTRQSEWCNYGGPVAEQHGGMLLMNDPENFRKPWWHAVETGLLVANPLGESELNGRGKRKENLLVKAGESFRLRYGVLIHLSDDDVFDPAGAYRDFVDTLATLKSSKNKFSEPQAALPKVPDGFEVSIYAHEPLVYKPTSLCFDAKGRLFLGQGPQYPENYQDSPTDSVQLLIDSDQDGVADQAKEFARGFNSIQGLTWKGNDLYVANAPELTLVRDLDGDDEADEYVVIYTDLGNREHALHGLTFGPDGKLYMSKGNSKGHNQPEKYGYVAPLPFRELWDVEQTPGWEADPPKAFTKETYQKTYHHWDDDWGREGGVLRCDPLGENLEIVSRGLRNPWDIAQDDGFNWLGTDNDQTQGDRIIMPFYGAHFGWGHRYSSHWSGAGHLPTVPVSGPLFSGSGAGIVYYAHKHFPPKYRNVYFINDWLFGTYVYRPAWDGALRMPVGGSLEPFMQRSEGGMLYRPTDLEFGPHGAIYSLGWGGNYHYEPGEEGSSVFRITYRRTEKPDTPPVAEGRQDRPCSERTVGELVQELGPHVLPARRVNAQDELVRRGAAIRNELNDMISGTGLTTGQQTWAVWALGRMKQTDAKHSEADSNSFQEWADPQGRSSRNLRIQAIRILGYRARRFGEKEALFTCVKTALPDADPRIRFEAMQAIHQAKLTVATGMVVEQLSKEADRLVYYAGWQAARSLASLERRRSWLDHENAQVRLAALLGLQEDFAVTQEEALTLVDQDTDPAVQSWALSFAINPRRPAKMPNTAARVELEQTMPVGQLIERARGVTGRPTLRMLYLQMLSRASVRGGEQQRELLEFYRTLDREEERTLLLPATATTLEAFPDLWEALGGAEPLQNAAVEGIRNLMKLRTAGLRSSQDDVQAAAHSLTSVDASAVEIASRLLAKLTQIGPRDERVASALRALDALPLPQDSLAMEDGLDALLTILESRNESSIRRPALRLLGKLRGGATGSERVAALVNTLCQGPDTHLYRELVAVVQRLGLEIEVPVPQAATATGVLTRLDQADADRGKEIFFDPVRGADCAACHAVRGRGSELAPDLSGVGARLTPENMVKALLEPSAAITEGYALQLLVTVDGQAHTGAVIRESDSAITLLRTDGTQVTVLAATVEQRKKLKQSVMPKGYELFGDGPLADLTAWLLTLRDGGSMAASERR
jgi:putative membrane-bound dehydrogenase-like protein